jgi:exopolysaccharide biosynthesis polyprenyl glycosylphosphotransferase
MQAGPKHPSLAETTQLLNMSYVTSESRIPLPLGGRHCLLLASFDVVALMLAWHLTVDLRVLLNPMMDLKLGRAAVATAAPPLLSILAVWVLVAVCLGVYRNNNRLATADISSVLKSVVVADTIVIVVTFFSREFGVVTSISRSFVVLFLPVSFLLMRSSRCLAFRAAHFEAEKWGAPERIAVLGQGPPARQMIESLRRRAGRRYDIVGIILPAGASSRGLGNPVPVLGTTPQLGEVINHKRIDRILLVNETSIPTQDLHECTRVSKRMGITVSRTVTALEEDANFGFSTLGNLHVVELKPMGFTRRQEFVKRAVDIILAVACMVMLSPIFVCVGLLIKFSSRGPILYRSQRVGKGGRHFTFLKFRSMYIDGPRREDLITANEQSGHLFKLRNDPRITPVGRFIRRFSIDELPQLINVFQGEMSMIGPRPLPAEDLDPDGQSRRFKAWAEQRSRVLPGITGLWQIKGRSEVPFEEMMELDVFYIRNWSLIFDLRVLLATPLAVLKGRGAY